MRSRQRRGVRRSSPFAGPRAGLALLVVLTVIAALLAACSAQATVDSSPAASADGQAATAAAPAGGSTTGAAGSTAANGDAGAKGASGADWTHALQVVANLKADPPAKPVVVLFGGSAARESLVSDASWRSQIEKKGGPATEAYDLGSRNRTLAQTAALVKAMPSVPTIVYIGVNLGAFTSPQKTASIALPKPAVPLPPYKQHQYTQSQVQSTAKKQQLIQQWLSERYPVFKKNFASSSGVLEQLIKTCQARKVDGKQVFFPVIFELPRDTQVIGSRLNAPIGQYQKKCKALAAKYKIPYVSFVAQAKLPNGDFYDLWHLVEPGRVVWQDLMAANAAALLKQYGME